jgi:hypothetical protein
MNHSWGALPILSLYIYFVALTPILVFVCRYSRWLLLVASSGVYLAVHAYCWISGSTWSHDELFLNPWSWQLTFVTGIASGAFRTRWRWPVTNRKAVLILSILVLQVCFIAKILLGGQIPGTDRVELGPLRFLHLCAIFILISWICSQARWIRIRNYIPNPVFEMLGRNALFAFCVGEFAVATTNLLLKRTSFSVPMQLLATTIALAIQLTAVLIYRRMKTVPGLVGHMAEPGCDEHQRTGVIADVGKGASCRGTQ